MLTFLRLVPSWVWVAILLVGIGLWWGESRHREGKDEVQAEWDAVVERGKAELAKIEREYRAQEHRHAADMARIGREHEQERKDAGDAAYQRAIADVRSGRLRGVWQCPRVPNTPEAGGTAAVVDDGADDRGEAIGRILRIAAECDSQVRGLQQVIRTDRK